VGGYGAKIDSWGKFCEEWKAVLDEYDAKYFHAREFFDALAIARQKRDPNSSYESNHYKGWDKDALDNFYCDLAKVIKSRNAFLSAAYIDTQKLAAGLKESPRSDISNPHEMAVWNFYESFVKTLEAKWPKLTGPVSVCFDQTTDGEWYKAITRIHHSYKKIRPRIEEKIKFGDKEDHLPLQAADMAAYRLRQIASKSCGYDSSARVTEFDRALFGDTLRNIRELYPVRG